MSKLTATRCSLIHYSTIHYSRYFLRRTRSPSAPPPISASARRPPRPAHRPGRASARRKARPAPKSHISSSSVGEAPGMQHPALAVERRHRLGPQPFAAPSPAPPSPARRGSTVRITAVTMSPPWFTSATMQSASSRWKSATAAPAQSCGRAARSRRVRQHHRAARPPSSPAATMPQASEVFRALAGGSTATTMRRSSGTSAQPPLSSISRDHSASSRSSISSPSSSCRPSRVPP